MLNIATIFSGIGAIEHAAIRLGIKHKIIFACDNGGVNIYKKNGYFYPRELLSLLKNLEMNLGFLISFNEEYEKKIREEFFLIKSEIEIGIKEINKKNINYDLKKILNILKENKSKKFDININLEDKDIVLETILELKKYLKKSNLNKFNSLYLNEVFIQLVNDEELKKIIEFLKDKSIKILKMKEIIYTQKHIEKMKNMSTFEEKKRYVDNLYIKYSDKNFVKKTYLANYNLSEKDFHWNVSLLDGTYYRGKVDLLVGGSPCQSFSMAGKRKGLEDTRGTLFYEFIRIVKEVQPKFFIYENVKGLLNHDKGKTWEIVKECFDELGYYYETKIFNSKNFGIPQSRERIFVIGFKNKEDCLNFSMTEYKELKYNMKDFLIDQNKIFYPDAEIRFIDYNEKKKYSDLEHISFDKWLDPLLLGETQKSFVTNEDKQKKKYTQINGEIMLTQRACQQYNLHGDFIEYNSQKYFLSEKVKKYVLDTESLFNTKTLENHINCNIAKAIVATSSKMHRFNTDNYITYGNEIKLKERKIRRLHPRECFRLMGFSDIFKIVVSDTQAYHQAGNSIVVDILIEILKGLIKIPINKK